MIEKLTLADPGPGEVEVIVDACAICHSDVSYADGFWGGDLPAVWGHEAVGRVTGVGVGVGLDIGQLVVVTLIRSCGECRHCLNGHFVTCTASFRLDEVSPLTDATGAPVTHGLRTAAFAEAVVVHESQVVPIPADMSPVAASLLACGVITGVGAVRNTAKVEPGTTVVVIGCGGVGLNVVQGARLAGAEVIVAIDLEQPKLEVARSLGATHVVDPARADAAAAVGEATQGHLADYVFVAVGSKAAVDSSYALVGAMGALVMVGMPATGVLSEFEPGNLAGMNQRILGSKMGTSVIQRDIPELTAEYQAGRLQLDSLVSATFPLDGINEAMDQVRAGTALRNVIVFGS
ncbi:MAG: zinc-binding dehydrogenase [Acidimicrobiales bacterium]